MQPLTINDCTIKAFSRLSAKHNAYNGKAFSYHKEVSKALDCDYFFADPYCSWQRGLNENTNGL